MILYLAIPALVLAILERWSRSRQPFFRARFIDDVGFLTVGWLAVAKLSLAYVASATLALHGDTVAFLPSWMLVVAAIVLLDLGNYVSHYLLHRVEALWEFHKVHHSSRKLDWLATFRSHLVEQILRRLVAPLGLIALGFPLGVVAIAGGIFTGWAIFNHANLDVRLGFLDRFVITPRLHRLHHAAATSDRNLGTVLAIWDRLRGTFVDGETDGPLGVPGEVESYPQGFFALLREPFRRIRRVALLSMIIVFIVASCATPPRRARAPRPPRPACTWEISGEVPLPPGL